MTAIADKARIKGKVAWKIMSHTEEGLKKLRELRELLAAGKITKTEREERRQLIFHDPTLSFLKVAGENHNIVTNEGDALIADIMAETPARTKVDNTNGYIEVGTGFATEVKTVLSCVTPTGSPEVMDASYPVLKGTWGNADDNVTQYRATFEAGDLNAVDIDEACLLNNAVAASGDALAYAEITPKVTVAVTDTLQMDWELTYVGS